MVELKHGNLLEADVEALVNTVNCVGFMGRGIALQFKRAFPANFKAYERACRVGQVVPGRMFVHENEGVVNPRYIINFPTKRHWRGKSRLEDIRRGLHTLVKEIERLNIRSIAVPPLGCGLGGLDWNVVRPLMEKTFEALPQVKVMLFEPTGAPNAREMPVRAERAKMTAARALVIQLMDRYKALDYARTLLEVHKLAYFLQEAGEQLRLDYRPAMYGPYADNLNKVLEIMEGHFIRGCGDSQKPDAEIELLPGAVDLSTSYLADKPESLARLDRVAKTIEGFETPYGMELLATVHWVAHRGGPANTGPARDVKTAIQQVHDWNPRKQRVFKPDHIHKAWEHLRSHQWMPDSAQR